MGIEPHTGDGVIPALIGHSGCLPDLLIGNLLQLAQSRSRSISKFLPSDIFDDDSADISPAPAKRPTLYLGLYFAIYGCLAPTCLPRGVSYL